jgi:hypothetical protein
MDLKLKECLEVVKYFKEVLEIVKISIEGECSPTLIDIVNRLDFIATQKPLNSVFFWGVVRYAYDIFSWYADLDKFYNKYPVGAIIDPIKLITTSYIKSDNFTIGLHISSDDHKYYCTDSTCHGTHSLGFSVNDEDVFNLKLREL